MEIEHQESLLSTFTGEFVAPNQEQAFRQHTERERFLRLRVIWAIACLFFLFFGLFDAHTIEQYQPIIILRLSIFSVGIAVILLTYSRLSIVAFDSLLFIALAAIALLYAGITYFRVESVPYQPGGSIVLSMGFYLFSPNRFSLTCANGLFCSILLTMASQGGATSSLMQYWQQNMYLLPANILAASALLQLNIIRRSNYIKQRQLETEVLLRKTAQRELYTQNKRSQQLLFDILPRHIVARIESNKSGQQIIADHHFCATVLVADIDHFSQLVATLPVKTLVEVLDAVHCSIEGLCQEHGMEKIQTSGNRYLLIAGTANDKANHALCSAEMALSMMQEIEKLSKRFGIVVQLRIGMHSGPIVSGVIGHRKLCYDVWGETVVIAGHIAANGGSGEIQLSAVSHELLAKRFVFAKSAPLQIDGSDPFETWALKDWRDIVSFEPQAKFSP